MKKLFIFLTLGLSLTIYPPSLSKAGGKLIEKQTVLHYLIIENSVLKYELAKDIANHFNHKEIQINEK